MNHTIDIAELHYMIDGRMGLCLECGDTPADVDMDTERDRCQDCGAHAVTGPEQLIFKDNVWIEGLDE